MEDFFIKYKALSKLIFISSMILDLILFFVFCHYTDIHGFFNYILFLISFLFLGIGILLLSQIIKDFVYCQPKYKQRKIIKKRIIKLGEMYPSKNDFFRIKIELDELKEKDKKLQFLIEHRNFYGLKYNNYSYEEKKKIEKQLDLYENTKFSLSYVILYVVLYSYNLLRAISVYDTFIELICIFLSSVLSFFILYYFCSLTVSLYKYLYKSLINFFAYFKSFREDLSTDTKEIKKNCNIKIKIK